MPIGSTATTRLTSAQFSFLSRFAPAGLILLSCAFFTSAQQQEPTDRIIDRSVEALKRDWAAALQFDCSERDVDKNAIKTYQDIMLDGSLYQKLIAVDDKPLDARQQAEQQQKFQSAFAQRRSESKNQRGRRIAKFEAERKHQHELMMEVTKAFTFTAAGTDKLDGYDVYAFNAEPRKGYRPASMETRVLTGMRGKFWIDRATFEWVRVEAQVIHPVSMAAFLARVEPGTRFELDRRPVSKDVWLASHFAVKSRSRVMFVFSHQTDEEDTWFNYHPSQRPTSSEPADQPPSP